LTINGDSGAYSGENGNCLVPPGGAVSAGTNGGAANTPGTQGSITLRYYS
jgi:hypothetical protein